MSRVIIALLQGVFTYRYRIMGEMEEGYTEGSRQVKTIGMIESYQLQVTK